MWRRGGGGIRCGMGGLVVEKAVVDFVGYPVAGHEVVNGPDMAEEADGDFVVVMVADTQNEHVDNGLYSEAVGNLVHNHCAAEFGACHSVGDGPFEVGKVVIVIIVIVEKGVRSVQFVHPHGLKECGIDFLFG